jgi:aromatic-L-amino-acid decarboxylase
MPETNELRDKLNANPIDFDWTSEQWQEIGKRVLELAEAVSTNWADRPPAPPADVDVGALFADPLPRSPVLVEEMLSRIEKNLVPNAAFNGHPRWFAYITASPTPISVLGDLLASALNQNTALWRLAPGATSIELQTVEWIKDLLGLPAEAEGLFVSGGQFANIVAHNVMRDAKTPWDVRKHGLRGLDGNAPRLRVYASKEVHYCHEQAADVLGLGRDAVRHVPVDDHYKMNVDALGKMIADDRAAGDLPVAVVGTAGTVGTGAVDPLGEILKVAHAEDLWFHVDGAYGAFAAIAPSARIDEWDVLAEVDSVACDPHKWLFSAIDAGVALINHKGLLNRSFAFHASYLETELEETEIDLLERSPENTRPFRALKVWLALQLYGADGYRDMIERNIQLSKYMEQLVEETATLTLAAPRELSIVCWRVEPPGVTDAAKLDGLQTDIIGELEKRGVAMVSNAVLADGRTALRACIVNFRTSPDDVEAVVRASAEIGRELTGT